MQELLSIRKVAECISYSKSWIYAKVREGKFPPPLDLPQLPGKNLWRAADVEDWIEKQLGSGKKKTAAWDARCDS